MSTELARPGVNGALSEAAAKLLYRDRNGQPMRPEQVELVIALCQRHGLVPELRHLVLIQDAAYVTNAGLLHVAHTSGDLDGIETRPATPDERATFLGDGDDTKTRVWRADVWLRNHTRPYTGWGKASSNESGAARTHAQEMSATRATNRALRLAFNVGFTSVEELPEEPTRTIDVTTGEVMEAPKPRTTGNPRALSQDEGRRLQDRLLKLGADQGYTPEQVGAWARAWAERAGRKHVIELDSEQARRIVAEAGSADMAVAS